MSPDQEAYPSASSSYSIRDIRSFVSGTEYVDFHITYDQSPTEVLLAGGVEVNIQPAAWMQTAIPRELDFGIAAPGATVTCTAQVQNVGSASLQITNITTTAADTTCPGLALPFTLAAGQSSNIVISINTVGLQGQISRQVRAYSTGRVRWPGVDDQINISGLVSDSASVYQVPLGGQYPDVSGDRIVYDSSRNGNVDIYAFNVADGSETRITYNTNDQVFPRISGNLIVWEDSRNEPSGSISEEQYNTDIFGYDLSRPDLGEFPICTNSGDDALLGVDGNKIAITHGYEVLYDRDNLPDRIVNNLLVYTYTGSGQVQQVYTTGWSPGSAHDPRQTVDRVGKEDFGSQLLVFSQRTITWVSDAEGGSWVPQSGLDKKIDYGRGESAPSTITIPGDYPVSCGQTSSFVTVWTDWEDPQGYHGETVWLWSNGTSRPLTTPGPERQDYGRRTHAMGQRFVVFDDNNSAFNYRLLYYDLVEGDLQLLTDKITSFANSRMRMDGNRVVWYAKDVATQQLGLWYADIEQADIQVTTPGITFANDNPVEGTGINISVLVRNLTSYNQSGNVTVNLYDGNPDSGGISLASGQTFSGLSANTDRGVIFSNVSTLAEGQHSIFAKLTVTTSDPTANNKASRTLTVQDSDKLPPTISNHLAVEQSGDGDGVVGVDENVRITWQASDPSGISLSTITLGGVTYTGSIFGANTIAWDNASNATYLAGWTNGSEGGEGWAAGWSLTNWGSPNAGFFIATTNESNLSTPPKAWGLWANSSAAAEASRLLQLALKAGDTLALKYDNNWIESGNSAGLALQNINRQSVFEFMFIGGGSNYIINDSLLTRDSGVPWSGDGWDLAVTILTNNQYLFTCGTNHLSGSLATNANSQVRWIKTWNSSAGPGWQYNVYFNDIRISGSDTQNTYYVDIANPGLGVHTVSVTAADADISSETRQSGFTFEVVPSESISVSYGAIAVSNGPTTLVDLGLYSQSVPPTPALFTVRNDGEQALLLSQLNVAGPIAKQDPGSTNIAPSAFTMFDLVPGTATEGSFTGTVSLVNSDAARSPFAFLARYEVRQDTDGDTVPDAWELAYFPELGNVTTNSDSDGDRSLDRDEFVADTDPTDSNDFFRVGDCHVDALSGGNAVITWDTSTGRIYTVRGSTNLLHGWSNILQQAGSGQPHSYTNQDGTSGANYLSLEVILQE